MMELLNLTLGGGGGGEVEVKKKIIVNSGARAFFFKKNWRKNSPVMELLGQSKL